jgi:hypothetical protein
MSEHDYKPEGDSGDGQSVPNSIATQKSLSLSQLVHPEYVKMGPSERQRLGVRSDQLAGPITLALVIGMITGVTEEKELPADKNGGRKTTYGLKGTIEVIDQITGETYAGSELYLPEGFHETALAEVTALLPTLQGSSEIVLQMQFDAFPTKSPSGYSWRMWNLSPARRADPLANLRRAAQKELRRRIAASGMLIEGPPAEIVHDAVNAG